eukprot:11047319-Heterocapsa_arctica.AAC.1
MSNDPGKGETPQITLLNDPPKGPVKRSPVSYIPAVTCAYRWFWPPPTKVFKQNVRSQQQINDL